MHGPVFKLEKAWVGLDNIKGSSSLIYQQVVFYLAFSTHGLLN